MQKIKFKIYTLGCKVNQYDSRSLHKNLLQAGFLGVEKNADLVVVNTCAVTESAIRKDKRMVKKAKKENPKAKLVVMGCLPEVRKEEFKNLYPDFIWGTGKHAELLEKISSLFKNTGCARGFSGVVSEDRARYFLKIQDGCEQFCSYCIIPYTRGKLKSRAWQEILTEAQEAVRTGFREIVLTGIHLGLYGAERKEKYDLVDLLEEILKIKDLGRVRLSSIEVTEVGDDLIKLIKNNSRICPHLHIPLQAGSDKVLKAMNRPYNSKYFKEKIKQIRKSIPDIAISTDVIVGFPGETFENFQQTYDFIQKTEFSRLHVFPFSAHSETPAYKLKSQIPEPEKAKRANRLRELGRELERKYKNKFKNKDLEVVVESCEKNKIKGRSQYYFDLEFRAEEAGVTFDQNNRLIGKIIRVKEKNMLK